jgi:hypothetical protein
VPGDSATHTGNEYTLAKVGVAALTLDNPEQGRWMLTITSRDDTAVGYAIDVSTDGPIEETAHLELMLRNSAPSTMVVARPGDPVFVRTFLTKNGKPVAGTHWDVLAHTPRDSVIGIPVFDDGHHADGRADDGVFVGALVAEGPDGHYQLRTEGRSRDSTQHFIAGIIQVHGLSDLLITDSIRVTPRSPRVGEPVTLTVTVRNDGTVEYKNVALELYVDMVKKSEQQIDLKPGESRRISTTWLPERALRYPVQLTLVSHNEPYWSDFTNNTRKTIVSVR